VKVKEKGISQERKRKKKKKSEAVMFSRKVGGTGSPENVPVREKFSCFIDMGRGSVHGHEGKGKL